MIGAVALVDSVFERLEAGVDMREEPNLEFKSVWPHGADAESQWAVADLVASLANDAHIDGPKAIVYGPADPLERPLWLSDEANLRSNLLRHFDGGVVPRLELFRRQVGVAGVVDVLVVVDQSEMPYVSRHQVGGEWVVRVRTNTSRRNATRAELRAMLQHGARPSRSECCRAINGGKETFGS